MNTIISGLGHCLPERVVDNDEISKRFSIPASRVFERTLIQERRYSSSEETASRLAELAIRDLLSRSQVSIDDIECVVMSGLVPDHFFPSLAVSTIEKLNAKKAWGFDLSASCSGFCYGIALGESLIQSGKVNNVIVCASERLTRMLNNFDYKTGVLFGDGAGAVLLQKSPRKVGIIDTRCAVYSDNINDVYFRTPFISPDWETEIFEMEGYKVFEHGVQLVEKLILQYLKDKNLTFDDFSYVIPHQSNGRMIERIRTDLNVPSDKMLTNISLVGNTGSASIPICLSQYCADGTIKKGNRLLLCSLGAGYTLSLTDLIWTL